MRDNIIGYLRVPGENENGRRIVGFYIESGLCLCNVFLSQEYTLIQ